MFVYRYIRVVSNKWEDHFLPLDLQREVRWRAQNCYYNSIVGMF